VTKLTDADRLMALLQAALDEADAIGSTLIAAMLAECIDAVGRDTRPRADPR